MPDAVAEHKRFIMVEAGVENHNKFWYATLFPNDDVKVEWGRVGVTHKDKLHPGAGGSFFEKKCREKLRKGYKELDVVETTSSPAAKGLSGGRLEQTALSQIGSGDAEIKKLVARLVSANKHSILASTTLTYDDSTGLFSTPCGVVSQNNVDAARDLLAALLVFVRDSLWADQSAIPLLEQYLTLIPQNMGMRKPTLRKLFPDTQAVQKQSDILDGLQGSLDSIKKRKKQPKKATKKNEPKVFDVSLERETDAAVIARVTKLYAGSRNRNHTSANLKVKRVFRVTISAMKEAFDKVCGQINNVQRLWHGTSVGNVLSILARGLIIPKSCSNGRMFGNGVYFSNQSTKALNYSYGYWGGFRDSACLMFLCDVALGKSHIPTRGWGSFPKKGFDSTFAKASASGVMNNEMIVYKTSQCNICYLVEFGN